MEVWVDGACRGNGDRDAIGAAAAVFEDRNGRQISWIRFLDSDYYTPVTNQRAELTSVIIALQEAICKAQSLDNNPRVDVTIHTDSKYVVGCMTKWIYRWAENGWVNSQGNTVANKDLIKEASDLDDELKEFGDVDYVWVPRSENVDADRLCNETMDENS